jgi:hypothetical protein
VSPSILSANFSRLGEEVRAAQEDSSKKCRSVLGHAAVRKTEIAASRVRTHTICTSTQHAPHHQSHAGNPGLSRSSEARQQQCSPFSPACTPTQGLLLLLSFLSAQVKAIDQAGAE